MEHPDGQAPLPGFSLPVRQEPEICGPAQRLLGGADRLGWRSLKTSPRDQWINWSGERKYERLQFIANNQRFLILPGVSIMKLASRMLALNVKRLPADWEAAHGRTILMVETFVDHSRFKGTCYRAAGWIKTSGYGRNGGIYYYHGQAKTVLVKPLSKKVPAILSAPFLPPELTGGKRAWSI